MSQKNMGRLAQDMKREVIAIIGRLKDPRLEGGLLTVTRLDVTPDLDVAKVYVSVMGREDGPKPAIEALNRAAGHVRTEVSKKMHIRKAPRFIFVEDDGAAYAAHINERRARLRVFPVQAAHSRARCRSRPYHHPGFCGTESRCYPQQAAFLPSAVHSAVLSSHVPSFPQG